MGGAPGGPTPAALVDPMKAVGLRAGHEGPSTGCGGEGQGEMDIVDGPALAGDAAGDDPPPTRPAGDEAVAERPAASEPLVLERAEKPPAREVAEKSAAPEAAAPVACERSW